MSKKSLILLTCLLLVGATSFVSAQTYVGSQVCIGCNGAADPTNVGYDLAAEYLKTGHPYKLNEVNGAPPVYPPNTSPGVPFAPPAAPNWNDYTYVIGGYGWKARFIKLDGFIFTADSAAQYNLETQGWVPYHFGEAKPYNEGCFQCHTTNPDTAGSWNPITPNLGTFGEPGIRCEGCHGPGSDHVANPTGVHPPIQADSLTYTRCGDCHHRGSKTNAIPASGGYIRHHEQFNEMKASRHGDGQGMDLTCGTCHDTHIALRYPGAAGAGLSAIKTECATCHPNHEIMVNGQIKSTECEDCHMPMASKSAVGFQNGNGVRGDVPTHIFQINTDPVPRDSMFEGGLVKLDAEGLAEVTLDFACLNCHQNQTLSWASYWADGIHTNGINAIGDDQPAALSFKLAQNYPNPFNPSTTIEYELPKTMDVRLVVYNVLGQQVKVLVNENKTAGIHKVQFSATDLPSGVYIYRLETGQRTLSRKMMLMR